MLLEMFFTFLKIGAFSFGGGFGMVPMIRTEIIEKRNWLSDEELVNGLAIAQSSPGPVAVNTCIYIGYKLKGPVGALVAVIGTVIPSFTIMVLVAKYLYEYRENATVAAIFKGVRPAIVALIFSAVVSIGRDSKLSKRGYIVAIAGTILIAFVKINSIFLIIAAAVGAVLLNMYEDKLSKK